MLTVKGVGPVWVGYEADATGPRASGAWFREVDRPYRVGRGVRVRIGHKGLAAGIVTKRYRDGRDDYTGLMAHDVEVPTEEIRSWGAEDEVTEEEASAHHPGEAGVSAIQP